MNVYDSYQFKEDDLPDVPKLEIYKETFGDLENVTNEWYKDSED